MTCEYREYGEYREAGMFAIRAERDYVVEEDFMKAGFVRARIATYGRAQAARKIAQSSDEVQNFT